jgi:hypothetical protein
MQHPKTKVAVIVIKIQVGTISLSLLLFKLKPEIKRFMIICCYNFFFFPPLPPPGDTMPENKFLSAKFIAFIFHLLIPGALLSLFLLLSLTHCAIKMKIYCRF